MSITAEMVKTLREKTGVGMMECKKALQETAGDIEKAQDYLRKKGLADASKRSGRATSEGLIESYIHVGSQIGVLVELNCETDFVARNDQFKSLARDIAMHIAASSPLYVSSDEVPADQVEKEKEILLAQPDMASKPDNVREKIISGRIEKFYEQVCLLNQPFVKDPSRKVEDMVKTAISTIGENIQIRRFVRFSVGEEA
ncbi:MAG: translation elongation factor Ts [Candidatus Melainabacteria bacterium HGW-Melainabacteria-1]|nr:MAG: translation elongation factor Ts [Candidatus Melainabacteria bacterium HGW-Melainabacteria-1]